MTTATDTAFSHQDIKPEIGARIHTSKEALLSGDYADELRDLLEQKGVLVFPQINFNDEEQIAFTKTLGTLAHERSGSGIYKITLDKSQTATADYLKGAFYWHFDGYVNEVPIRASILSAKVLSPTGGITELIRGALTFTEQTDPGAL